MIGNKRGVFITLEGIEGAGKSTQVEFITKYLSESGQDVLKTREPGGTAYGDKIRKLLLDKNNEAMFGDTELLLMFASRVQHLKQVILPALAIGKTVVCDRFIDSSYAYQGGGRGISEERITQLECWVLADIPGLKPDLTLLLDVSAKTGRARAGSVSSEADRFESEDLNFLERVRSSFLEIARREKERVVVIDAEEDSTSVQSAILETFTERDLCRHKD